MLNIYYTGISELLLIKIPVYSMWAGWLNFFPMIDWKSGLILKVVFEIQKYIKIFKLAVLY